jgi:23S rRNA (cytosine1962-C5)-methyltransferase
MIHLKKPDINILSSNNWQNYELIDSGNGEKLESFADHTIVRPAPQAIWMPALSKYDWQSAEFIFASDKEESKDRWQTSNKQLPSNWLMHYDKLIFQISITNSRHIGVFPEQAPQWDWIRNKIERAKRPIRVLNLFGYTGLATLAAVSAGAQVTHVDALHKSILQGQHNQKLSAMGDAPIRWIVDDAVKFVQRENRRQSKYDALILDPPKFGRGPKGQVWEIFKLLPYLLDQCCQILSENPCFIVLTAYAVQISALSLIYCLDSISSKFGGTISCGELALKEKSRGRYLSMAIFARWSSEEYNN